jgi:hypothetical protein
MTPELEMLGRHKHRETLLSKFTNEFFKDCANTCTEPPDAKKFRVSKG